MAKKLKITLYTLLALLIIAFIWMRFFGPAILEKAVNPYTAVDHNAVSPEASNLHADLKIMDWHADSLLWERDFLAEKDYGKVSLPRLKRGNIKLQMLTTVTKASIKPNYVNEDGSSDVVGLVAPLFGWPTKTWNSFLERALYQSDRLNDAVARANGELAFIKSQEDLTKLLSSNNETIGLLLGTEGAHPLEGKIENIDRMYEAGFRMFGITHFFDNELAGSFHGISREGLSDFGRKAITRLDELEIIIDLAHVSEKAAWQILELSNRPQVVSHTGLKGACDTPRNYPDELMKAIAAKGGLIAIGFWDAAVCDASPSGVAKSIKYGIELVGADHIALGSDWDGGIKSFAADDIVTITDALIKLGVGEVDIRKVMGENSIRFLAQWLPKS